MGSSFTDAGVDVCNGLWCADLAVAVGEVSGGVGWPGLVILLLLRVLTLVTLLFHLAAEPAVGTAFCGGTLSPTLNSTGVPTCCLFREEALLYCRTGGIDKLPLVG